LALALALALALVSARLGGATAGTVRGGGIVTLQTIDVDQHLFESRTTWSDYIDPARRADALTIADDEAGWPWLTWRGTGSRRSRSRFRSVRA